VIHQEIISHQHQLWSGAGQQVLQQPRIAGISATTDVDDRKSFTVDASATLALCFSPVPQ
jgi:hypothetical protein